MSQIDDEKSIESSYSLFGNTIRKRERHPDDPQPPPKRQKSGPPPASDWTQIFKTPSKPKQLKQKKNPKKTSQLPKIVRDKLYKQTEAKFMALANKQKQLLLNQSIQQDETQFGTIREMTGFSQAEEPHLFTLMNNHLNNIRIQEKSIQDIIFDNQPQEHYERPLKQLWNKKSNSVMTAQKRLTLVELHKSGFLKEYVLKNNELKTKNIISEITSTLLSATRSIIHVKETLKLPSIKKKNNKLTRIESTLKSIRSSNNRSTPINLLCDQLLQMRHLLKICLSELNAKITEIDILLINLRIIRYNGHQRIHLNDKKITGLVPRYAGLLAVFDNTTQQLKDIKNVVAKKDEIFAKIIQDKKLKSIESKASKMRKAKVFDAKRKQEREEREEQEKKENDNVNNNNTRDTEGLIVDESDEDVMN